MSNAAEQVKELRKIWSSFQSSRVLMTAANFRMFDYLETRKTARKVAKELGTDVRATEIVLDALTGMGLLKKRNDGYVNSPLASRFLVSGRPHYQGDIIRHAHTLWEQWSHLDEVLRTGAPASGSFEHEAFILGMHNLASMKVKEVVDRLPLKGVERALDIGGGPGTYAIEMARRGIHAVLFDRRETINIARGVVRRSGVDGKRIAFLEGDFVEDDIGKGYDLIFISQVLHSYSEKTNISLLRKCRRALNAGGRIIVQEMLLNEDRSGPLWGTLFAVNMLVNTEGGRSYSPGEIKQWMLKAGFKTARKTMAADAVLVSGRKKE